MGETSNKKIRLTKPYLLMLPLKLFIPLRIQLSNARLSTIQLTEVHQNEGDTLKKLVIMLDPMLRHVI